MDDEGAFLVLIVIIVRIVTGVIAAAIASHKGRSVAGWFFGGLLLELIGVIIVAVLPNLKEKQAELLRTERERHRLREQLRQERLKNEAYRLHSAGRLDAHDDMLGVDTRSQTALTGGDGAAGLLPGQAVPLTPPMQTESPDSALRRMAQAAPAGQPPPAPPAHTPPPDDRPDQQWFYEVNGVAEGPVAAAVVRSLIRSGRIKKQTLLWTAGFTEWTAASQVEAFSAEVGP